MNSKNIQLNIEEGTQLLMMSRVNLLPGASFHIILEAVELHSLPFWHLEYSLTIVNMI